MRDIHLSSLGFLSYTILPAIVLLISAFTQPLSEPGRQTAKGMNNDDIEVANLYTKGTRLFQSSCNDSLCIQLIKSDTGYIPVNLNIKIINQESPFATKVDTTITVNRLDVFDTLICWKLPAFDKRKTNYNDIIVVEALPGDSSVFIGDDTTKLKKNYCVKYSLDEINHADGCKPNDTTYGFSYGVFVAGFDNSCGEALPVKSVEHVFRDTAGASGKQYRIVVYGEAPGGGPGTLLYESSTLTSPAGTGSDQRVEHFLTSNVSIPAGEMFFAGVRQLETGSIHSSGQKESPVRMETFYASSDSGFTWSDFRSLSINIRLDMEPQTYPQLYLELINQGFYNNIADSSVTDTFRVYARYPLAPYTIADSSVGIVSGTDLDGIFKFNSILRSASYFLEVTHRNHVSTWSSAPVLFRRYDLIDSAASAYGSNLALSDNSPLRYGIYAGDVNHDGYVDASDIILVENDAVILATGYIDTDLTGDDFVDITDFSICDNNAALFISTMRP